VWIPVWGGANCLAQALWKVRMFTAPRVNKPETIHIVLAVTDTGKPALTRYQRVIVTVYPD
jgi:hypothetical protein